MSGEEKRNLDVIRCEIDQVDRDLAQLLERRMDLVSEVADYKIRTGMKVLDTSRESRVMENVLGCIKREAYRESIQDVFAYMMKVSREYQGKRMEPIKQTFRFGLLGEKLSHSVSPRIHALILNHLGITGSYDLVETPRENLAVLLQSLRSNGMQGVNVTVPYKTDVMPFLDELSEEARHIGAVNTISTRDGLKGYNTDYHGFGASLRHRNILVEGRRCAVLGSGGAAHAVVAWLEDHQAREIVIVSRDPDAAMFKFPGIPSVPLECFRGKGYDMVINTTPLGMYPKCDASPLAREQLEGVGFVMDLIYNPAQTLLLKVASELGIPSENGLFMLVAQAVFAEGIWLGKDMEAGLIQQIYHEMKKNL